MSIVPGSLGCALIPVALGLLDLAKSAVGSPCLLLHGTSIGHEKIPITDKFLHP